MKSVIFLIGLIDAYVEHNITPSGFYEDQTILNYNTITPSGFIAHGFMVI